MDKKSIAKVRRFALEEFRQELKSQKWTIDNLIIVDKVCKRLQEIPPDKRYFEGETNEH